ncbi:metallophosphoesterase [Actinomycetaceae bacterium TAE3-ERU4]|nr:metallophosphoesterase [Actinomycetaceae bacterium TAE3-ERU4]
MSSSIQGLSLLSKIFKGVLATAGLGAIAGASALAWGSVERRWPRVEHLQIDTGGRLRSSLRILHISDLHLRPADQWLIDYTRNLARFNPDLVVSTGDNFGSLDALEALKEAYNPLLSFPGVFVYGSNDFYSPKLKPWHRYLLKPKEPKVRRNVPDLPTDELTDFFTAAGWVELTNTDTVMDFSGGDTLSLSGTGDAHIKRDRLDHVGNWPGPENALRIAVTHAPYARVLNAFEKAESHLLLAGHTHGGQLCVPGYGAIVTNCDLPREFAQGLFRWVKGKPFKLEDSSRAQVELGSLLSYVCAGLGTNKFAPFRIACRPTVTVLDLR